MSFWSLIVLLPLAAQAGDPATPQPADARPAANLATEKPQVAAKFSELEQLLIKMAELTAPTDPRRASLLRQAVAQSKDRAIDDQLQALVALLKKNDPQYHDVI